MTIPKKNIAGNSVEIKLKNFSMKDLMYTILLIGNIVSSRLPNNGDMENRMSRVEGTVEKINSWMSTVNYRLLTMEGEKKGYLNRQNFDNGESN